MPFLRTRSRSTWNISLQPDRHAVGAAALARLLVHVGPAAGGKHRRTATEQAGDNALLALPEVRLAVLGEDLRNTEVGGLLDLAVGIQERQVQEVREPLADRCLARPHHADEHDAAFAELREHTLDLPPIGDGLTCFHDAVLRGRGARGSPGCQGPATAPCYPLWVQARRALAKMRTDA